MLKIIGGAVIVFLLHAAVGAAIGTLMEDWKIGAIIGCILGILLTAVSLILDASRPEGDDRKIVAIPYIPLAWGGFCAVSGMLGAVIGKFLNRWEMGIRVGLILGVILGASGAISVLHQLAGKKKRGE